MISRETFCKALKLLKQQQKLDDDFSDALQTMGNGFIAFGSENKYLEALLLVLKESVDDKYDYVDWWLFDASDYMVYMKDEKKKWDLKEPEALYDYIVNEAE